MSKFKGFIQDVLSAPKDLLTDSKLRHDYAKALLEKHFTDEVLKDIPVQTGGHDRLHEVMTLGEINDYLQSKGVYWEHKYSYNYIRESLSLATTSGIYFIVSGGSEQTPDEEYFVELFSLMARLDSSDCQCCGNSAQQNLDLESVNFIISGTDNEVSCPAKILVPEAFEFTAPSGKIVIANDLRGIIPGELIEYQEPGHEEYEAIRSTYFEARGVGRPIIMSHMGQRANRDFYLNEHNLVFLQAGNSSPSIFYGDGFLQIGQDRSIEGYHTAEGLPLNHIGSICTDLWAVCLMDYDVFCRYVNDIGREPAELLKELDAHVIDVPDVTMTITDHYTATSEQINGVIARIDFKPEIVNENTMTLGM